MLTWKLNLTGLIYFTSSYFGKNTSASLQDLRTNFFSWAPVSCQAQLGCAVKLTEAGFLRISLPRPTYPPSSFLHPSAVAPSCGTPGCLGVPSGRVEVPAPSPRAQLPLLCLLGTPTSISPMYSHQVSLLDLLCHMPVSGQMVGGRRKAGEEMWWADGVNVHTAFPRETRLNRSSLL